MRNHDQKAKDMAESVLPSTARRRAHEGRRALHAQQRSRQRDQLRLLQLTDPETDFDTSLERRRRANLSEMVWDRRDADKTSSLERWARVRVQRDPALRRRSVEEQVAEITRLLPDNLIGRHAAQHIRWALEADVRPADWQARVRNGSVPESLTATVADVQLVLERGRHRHLNNAVRALVRAEEAQPAQSVRAWYRPNRTELRLLAGLHDVEDFAAVHHRNASVREALVRLAR